MARNNQVNKNMDTIVTSMKKKEFIIGLVSVVVVIVALVGILYKGSFNRNQKILSANQPKIVSPVVTSPAPKKMVPSLPTSKVNKITQIKQLADTSGYSEEMVRDGDNFWTISKRVCGDGRYYLSIKEANGYDNRTLQPGDIINVSCAE